MLYTYASGPFWFGFITRLNHKIYPNDQFIASDLQALIHELWFASFDSRAVICKLWFTNCDLQALIHELWFASFDSRAVICKLWFTSCNLQDLIHELRFANFRMIDSKFCYQTHLYSRRLWIGFERKLDSLLGPCMVSILSVTIWVSLDHGSPLVRKKISFSHRKK